MTPAVRSLSARLRRLYEATLRRLPLLYGAWAVLVAASLAWVTPAWQNPDEPAHAKRVVQISSGRLLGQRIGRNAGGISDSAVDTSFKAVGSLPFHFDARADAAMLQVAAAVRWGRLSISAFDNTATYPPFLYATAIPAAWIGRYSHMHVVATLRLMRLFDGIAAAALGSLALATARRTRIALAAVLLLPMSVALAASPSQDALLIPLAAWAVAAIDRARGAPAADRPTTSTHLGIAGGLLLIMLARPPYLPLAALLLLLPGRRARLRIALALAVAVVTLLWTAYVSLRISVRLNFADPARQAAFLLHHPLAILDILARTWGAEATFYLSSTIGVLGWLDASLPKPFILAAACIVLLALASATTPDAERAPVWRGRTAVGVTAVLGAAFALFLSIYVIWSLPGGPTVVGIQGRYFLPLLPALALGMPDLGRWAAMLRPPALVAVLLLAATGPVVTITTLIDRYYLAP